jgi:hypothetical protein
MDEFFDHTGCRENAERIYMDFNIKEGLIAL